VALFVVTWVESQSFYLIDSTQILSGSSARYSGLIDKKPPLLGKYSPS